MAFGRARVWDHATAREPNGRWLGTSTRNKVQEGSAV